MPLFKHRVVVIRLCAVLTPSGYYDWISTKNSTSFKDASRSTYGSIHKDLIDEGNRLVLLLD